MPRWAARMLRSVGSQTMPASALIPCVEGAPRPLAALEVVGDRQHDHLAARRLAERGKHRRRHHHAGGAAFHVSRAGAVDLAVADRRAPRIEAPRLRRRVDVVVAAEEAGRSKEASPTRPSTLGAPGLPKSGRSTRTPASLILAASRSPASRQFRHVAPQRLRLDDLLQETDHLVGMRIDVVADPLLSLCLHQISSRPGRIRQAGSPAAAWRRRNRAYASRLVYTMLYRGVALGRAIDPTAGGSQIDRLARALEPLV